MKKLCANNILTNPEGWAGDAVGTLWRYRFLQGLTLFGGVALFLLFVFLLKRRDYGHYFGVVVLISAFCIAFPLMYLRALRALYIKTQCFEGNRQGGLPDAQKTAPR
jgi:hypothetical protein